MPFRFVAIWPIGILLAIEMLIAHVEAQEFGRTKNSNRRQANDQKAVELNRQGLKLLRVNDFEKAIELFTQVIEVEPSFVPYLNRGIARSENKQYGEAIDDLTTAISLNARSAEAHYLRATAYYEQKKLEQAKTDVDKALELKPNFAEALNVRGRVYHAAGDLDKALEDYNASIKLAPNESLALRNRGLLWIDREQYKKAIDDFSAVLRLVPDDVDATMRRGWSYLKLHQYDKAAADLERSAKLAPDDHRCVGILAWLLSTCPDPKYRDGKRAVQLATASLQLAKDRDAGGFDILAAAYAEVGDFGAAAKAQQQAIEMETDKVMLAGYRERLSLYKSKRPYRLSKD